MFQFTKGLFDVAIHRKDASSVSVIPFEVDANVLIGALVTFDGIMLPQGRHQMSKIVVTMVFDQKVINNKGE